MKLLRTHVVCTLLPFFALVTLLSSCHPHGSVNEPTPVPLLKGQRDSKTYFHPTLPIVDYGDKPVSYGYGLAMLPSFKKVAFHHDTVKIDIYSGHYIDYQEKFLEKDIAEWDKEEGKEETKVSDYTFAVLRTLVRADTGAIYSFHVVHWFPDFENGFLSDDYNFSDGVMAAYWLKYHTVDEFSAPKDLFSGYVSWGIAAFPKKEVKKSKTDYLAKEGTPCHFLSEQSDSFRYDFVTDPDENISYYRFEEGYYSTLGCPTPILPNAELEGE